MASAKRFTSNPLISPKSSPTLGDNINGPSVIQVPSWLPNPLGKYYLYFGHHTGKYIRLAYANKLKGPWEVYEPGTLHLDDAKAFGNHIASPDVHVDEATREIRMYFHGRAQTKPGQFTGVAYSEDGLRFSAKDHILGSFYFRVWQYRNSWYAIAKNGNKGWGEIYRASHPDGPFELRGNFLKDMRHAAVLVDGVILKVFYSRVGDMPERILMTTVDMRRDWLKWQPTDPIEVLRPKKVYEGANYPIAPSSRGSCTQANQLRDPFVILKKKKTILFYTGAGESNICAAKISDLSSAMLSN